MEKQEAGVMARTPTISRKALTLRQMHKTSQKIHGSDLRGFESCPFQGKVPGATRTSYDRCFGSQILHLSQTGLTCFPQKKAKTGSLNVTRHSTLGEHSHRHRLCWPSNTTSHSSKPSIWWRRSRTWLCTSHTNTPYKSTLTTPCFNKFSTRGRDEILSFVHVQDSYGYLKRKITPTS